MFHLLSRDGLSVLGVSVNASVYAIVDDWCERFVDDRSEEDLWFGGRSQSICTGLWIRSDDVWEWEWRGTMHARAYRVMNAYVGRSVGLRVHAPNCYPIAPGLFEPNEIAVVEHRLISRPGEEGGRWNVKEEAIVESEPSISTPCMLEVSLQPSAARLCPVYARPVWFSHQKF